MSDMFVRVPSEKCRSKGEGRADFSGGERHLAKWTNTFCNMDKYIWSDMFVRSQSEMCRSKADGEEVLNGGKINLAGMFVRGPPEKCRSKGEGRVELREQTNRSSFSQVNTCEKLCIYLDVKE